MTGRKSQTTADSRAILERHWLAIEQTVDREPDGPWMRAVTHNGLCVIVLS